VTTTDIFLWIVIPYVAITILIVGHIWRYRRDQFGWTSRSNQLLERRLLKWGSPLFHYGALAAIAGHVLGILIPQTATNAIGIHERAYHFISAIPGTIAGAAFAARPADPHLPPGPNSSRRGDDVVLPRHGRDLVPGHLRAAGPRPPDDLGTVRVPAPRPLSVGDHRALAVQPPGTRLEHPAAVHRPPLHPLPARYQPAR
jgi:Nitrate reductase gamma subunit